MLAVGLFVLVGKITPIRQYLDAYAIQLVGEQYGYGALPPAQEAKILGLAIELGIADKIIVRKMNTAALQMYGYHNAFACTAQWRGFLPLSFQPFVYVSESFLEDLSEQEQRFLIGHELIHARERHLMFLNLINYLVVLLLLLLWMWLIVRLYSRMITTKPYWFYLVAYLLLCLVVGIPKLGYKAYCRHIEWVADRESLQLLNTYEGCLKALERWQKDFGIPEHNADFGLLADHPSCYERKEYCLALQTLNQGKDL